MQSSSPVESCDTDGSKIASTEDRFNNALFEPIAICGMAFRLPGGAHDDDSFWDLLVNGRDARVRIPASRFNVDAFYSDKAKPGTIRTQHGYFLEQDVSSLDTAFFSVSKSELQVMDPQQRLLLEVTCECLENAGEVNWRGLPIGCYVGTFGEDWLDECTRDLQDSKTKMVSGYNDFAVSNRVSYEFDFRGPSLTTRTACSSSLIALHQACQALRSGDCTAAIVAGANLIMTPTMSIAMSQQGVLSPDGSCKTFDACANGYARGEAINCVYLKPLSRAVKDRSPIRAVIRGSGVNFDGKTANVSTPSSEAQEALMRDVYRKAKIEFKDTIFVECHGTGTPVGDPIEAKAVARCFRSGVLIGSVKPNIGHSEGASGLTSLIKSVLALERKIVPPNIKFDQPNPTIDFKEWGLTVPKEPVTLPTACTNRISINSFGIGGANAHVVVEAFQPMLDKHGLDDRNARYVLLPFSACSGDSLQHLVEAYQTYIQTSKHHRWQDLAYTLSVRRQHLPYRAFGVLHYEQELPSITIRKTPFVGPRRLVMVFTGQGAQWPGMGREMIQQSSTFRRSIEFLDESLAKIPHAPEWRIMAELLRSKDSNRMHLAEFSQPLCTAIQIALVDCLRHIGVFADAVVGHSSGEIAAAYAAGALTSDEAIIAAYYRGLVCRDQPKKGSMAAVGLGWDQAESYLTANAVVACDNSPSSVTISGDSDAVEQSIAKIVADQPAIFTRMLRVDMAYHSPHMVDVSRKYRELLDETISGQPPLIPFYSSVTQDFKSCGPKYWQANLESPVRFKAAIQAALRSSGKGSIFLEIGPHSALQGPLRETVSAENASDVLYVSTLLRDSDAEKCFLTCLGNLYSHGVALDFEKLNPPGSVLSDLPSYPWDHTASHWYESRLVKSWKSRDYAYHDLLGTRVVESSLTNPIWRNVLSLDNIPWLRDHKIRTDFVMPSAAYIVMATEAMRQTTPGCEQYSLRNVIVKKALLLHESQPLELVTSLSQQKLTNQLDSAWWNFSIACLSGTKWIQHCVGQVRVTDAQRTIKIQHVRYSREVESRRWYEVMRESGLNYGLEFSLQRDISASPSRTAAAATIANNIDPQYPVHPTSIDQMLQIFTVAAARGLSRNIGRLRLPSAFGQIEIRKAPAELLLQAEVQSRPTGDLLGTVNVTDNHGEVYVTLRGVHLTLTSDDIQRNVDDLHAMAQMKWRPDVDFIEANSLIYHLPSRRQGMALVNRITALIIIEMANKLDGVSGDVLTGDLGKYLTWNRAQQKALAENSYPFISDGPKFIAMSSDDRKALIESLLERVLKHPQGADTMGPILALYNNLDVLLAGNTDPTAILFSTDVLTKMYNVMYNIDDSSYVRALGHDKPHMRILEVGAGTGGTTQHILSALIDTEAGTASYSTYVFTDVSLGFFGAAKERFAYAPNLVYKCLDISKDPEPQGFELNSFDLIIAANVVHTTSGLNVSLRNIRSLLKADGRLYLHELCPPSRWLNFVFGALPGWWNGAEDGRIEQPYVSPERWEEELHRAGFDGLENLVYDDVDEARINALMVARPSVVPVPANGPQRSSISLLVSSLDHSSVVRVYEKLCFRYKNTILVTLNDPTKLTTINGDIIALLDLDNPFFANASNTDFEALQQTIIHLSETKHRLLWVTKPSSLQTKNPEYAQSLGFARVIRSEMNVDMATLEIEDSDLLKSDTLLHVYGKFAKQDSGSSGTIISDYEYLFHAGQIHTGRYYPTPFSKALQARVQPPRSARLQNTAPGILSSLRWVGEELPPLSDWEVQVDMKAVGVNFKDILIAMGMIDSDHDGLGLEGAGIVSAVGKRVADLHNGDRVMLLGTKTFATTARTHRDLCVKIPGSLTFEQAATMPCVYATVIRALLDVGGLEEGQSVLIHSACGGVGLAAIQISQMIGAEVFVTVGNDQKVAYLQEHFNLPRNRIFRSRDTSFLPEVLEAANGMGVDVALNSLSGELLHATWACVAPFGKMVEIGKRDLIGKGTLALDVFEANRTYSAVDLTTICSDRTKVARKLLERVVEYHVAGHIKPIPIARNSAATDIQNCFRSMHKGEHIGKIVVNMSEDVLALNTQIPSANLRFDSDATYLLVGGLGGLGKPIATWLAEHGARSLVFLSPNAGKRTSDHEFVRELEDMGCTSRLVAGNVEVLSDVQQAISQCPLSRPLKGILQMSMLLKDRLFPQMTYEDWRDAVSCKVQGTWNLHHATIAANVSLDFLVLFSSISGIIGNRGQANYAAANAFLDAFVPYRRSLGLPCSAIDIGLMEDIGAAKDEAALVQTLKAYGNHPIHEPQLLDTLRLAILDQGMNSATPVQINGSKHGDERFLSEFMSTHPVLGIRSATPLSTPENRVIWKRDARFSYYHRPSLYESSTGLTDGVSSATDPSAMASLLQSIRTDPETLSKPSVHQMISREIAFKLFDLFLKPTDGLNEDALKDVSLFDLGLDSLVAVEVRNWWGQAFGFQITMLDLLVTETVGGLADKAVAGLKAKYVPNAGDDTNSS